MNAVVITLTVFDIAGVVFLAVVACIVRRRERQGRHCPCAGRAPRAGFLHWLKTGEFLLPPAPYVPAREAAESARGPEPLEKAPAAGAAPVISETGAVPPPPGTRMRDCCLSPDDESWHWASCPTVDDEERARRRRLAAELAATASQPTPEANPWDDGPDPDPYEPDEDGLNRYRTPMSPDPAQVLGVGWQVPDDYQPAQVLPGGRGLMRVGRPPWDTAAQPAIPAPEPKHAYDPGDGNEPPVPLARPYAPEVMIP